MGTAFGQADGVTTTWRPRDVWPAVLAAAFFGPTLQALDVLSFDEAWSWAEAAGRSAFFAVVMALGLVLHSRFSASGRERALVERALTVGALPDDAGGEWLGRLSAARHRLRSDRTGLPGITALAALLVAVACLQPDGPGAGGWVYVAVLVALGAVFGLRQQRRMETAARLSAELEERLARA